MRTPLARAFTLIIIAILVVIAVPNSHGAAGDGVTDDTASLTALNEAGGAPADGQEPSQDRNQQSAVILENSQLLARFSRENGSLLELTNKMTGWRIQNRPDLALSFRLQVPLPERRANRVDGTQQRVDSVELSPDGRQVTFTWRDLKSEHGGTLDIIFRGTVTIDGPKLTFTAELNNQSSYPVEAASYPCVGDLSQPSIDETLFCMSEDYDGMEKTSLLPYFTSNRAYWGFDYPFVMIPSPETPFVLIGGEREGLYVASHDNSLKESIQYAFEVKPGFEWADSTGSGYVAPQTADGRPSHMEFSVVHFPFVLSGERFSLSPIVLAPYSGSWHKGADVYKGWRSTWFARPSSPAWANDVHSWQQFQMNSSEDEIRCNYGDLVELGRECAREGIKALQLVGWNKGGQDRGNPSHDTDPRLGTPDELREAIAQVQSMGVNVVLFSKYTWADRANENFKTELIRYTTKDPYGDPHFHPGYSYHTLTQLAGINTRRFAPMCPLSAEWRQAACHEFRKTVDLGAAGMIYDENRQHGGVRYCFDPNHGHHLPAHVFAGSALLDQDFRAITDTDKPDFLFAGEANNDLQNLHYNISYFRIGRDHIPWERYVDPYAGIMAAVIGLNDRDKINQCLMYRYIISYEPLNFKGRLSEMPRTVEYGNKIDGLRRQYRQFLWDGEFRDRLEARVTVNGEPYNEYTVYRDVQTGKHAVVITNRDVKQPLQATVTLDNGATEFLRVSPEDPSAQPTGSTVEIPPLSAVIVLES